MPLFFLLRPALRAGLMATLAMVIHSAVHAATLVIGQVAPLTGLEAIQGRAYSAGLQLALDSANKVGGVAGHTFSLVRHDDSSRPEDTVAQTQKLPAVSLTSTA